MTLKIGIVSQKGGVGKSTLSRAIATSYAAADWKVKIADLDISQGTSYFWLKRRFMSEFKPEFGVETFRTVTQALKIIDSCDVMVFDGAPHATLATAEIARISDLVILPTGLSIDDLEPTVMLANELVKKNDIAPEKISFALCRTGNSNKELIEAKEYLNSTPYHIIDGMLQEKTAFRRAQDLGLSVIESQYKQPRTQARKMIKSIIDRVEFLTD